MIRYSKEYEEFWEKAFSSNARMWGEKATDNAYQVLEILKQHQVQNMLIPGFGYGRNAQVFHEAGIEVSGIEISETAIARARKHFKNDTTIHHGSVEQMPFDEKKYQAIYSYSLIHLLSKAERRRFIAMCHEQLEPGGIMVTVGLSTEDIRFGQGEYLGENTFRSHHGLKLFFYDQEAVQAEFADYGIIEQKIIHEPLIEPQEKHWMIFSR